MSALWDGVREGCGSCEFALPHNGTTAYLTCGRYPPTLLQGISNHNYSNQMIFSIEQVRPSVAVDDWCGEYKRKVPA